MLRCPRRGERVPELVGVTYYQNTSVHMYSPNTVIGTEETPFDQQLRFPNNMDVGSSDRLITKELVKLL